MKHIGIIGHGAIASYFVRNLGTETGFSIKWVICRPGRESSASLLMGESAKVFNKLEADVMQADLFLDCAGHGGLLQHGANILESGIDLVSVSSGALADVQLCKNLRNAAEKGGGQLFLVSGAIGALDALSSAQTGGLKHVIYKGRKPPLGWKGSPAEKILDLEILKAPETHFKGNARDAALQYPKNANVAASVALAGLGFEDTQVELIADPGITTNIHEIEAKGIFGSFTFQISGNALPDNPKSSALTAMSMVRAVHNRSTAIKI